MIVEDVVVNVVRSVDDVDVDGSRENVTILPTAPNCRVCRSERRRAEDWNEWQAMNERVDTKIKFKTFIVFETISKDLHSLNTKGEVTRNQMNSWI